MTTAQPPRQYRPEDPSFWRRKHLLSELGDDGQGSSAGGIAVSSFFPLERYYEAADKVLAAFEEAVGQGDLDASFVYGKRFCIFCIENIPNHNYYNSPRFARQKLKYRRDAATIMDHLEDVKKKMDAEERVKYKKRLEAAKAEAARREAERKRQEALMLEREKKKYQELMRRAELQKQNSKISTSSSDGGDVKQSALNKLEMLMKQSSAASSSTPDDNNNELPPPPSYGDTQSKSDGSSLPPAMTPSSSMSSTTTATNETPPPYEFAVNNNGHHPFLGPTTSGTIRNSVDVDDFDAVPPPPSYGSVGGTSSLPDPPSKRYPTQSKQPKQVKRKKKIPVRQMREKAQRRYQELLQQGRIEVRPIGTHQGRCSQSTNGCTVISALMVAHHLATSSGVVLPDREIKHVIDKECGPLLREIRGKLGLENHSLIIPSDVHDHLVDKHILKQDYFVGATGGSIISDKHMDEVFKLFGEKKKAGATLFFREHVISIAKIPVGGGGKAYYDFIDSLPGTRTRCKDEEALDVLLSWYATKRLEGSASYIDNNDWNDNMADLDPRVFQAFVWGKDA